MLDIGRYYGLYDLHRDISYISVAAMDAIFYSSCLEESHPKEELGQIQIRHTETYHHSYMGWEHYYHQLF